MEYKIPPFPIIHEGLAFPGHLSEEDAATLERIHKRLRASVSIRPDRFELSVCKAVQQCYDLLKRIYARRSAFNSDVLEKHLPEKTLTIALECRWLPKAARADSAEWREWVKELLAGRFSQAGVENSDKPDPYLSIPFPQVVKTAEHPAVQGAAENVADAAPQNVADAVATERKTLLAAFKTKARRKGIKVTDEMVARAAKPEKWNDRTMVTWWKRDYDRCKPPDDRMIRAVLVRDPSEIWPLNIKP